MSSWRSGRPPLAMHICFRVACVTDGPVMATSTRSARHDQGAQQVGKGARQTIPGLFVARQIEMLESPPWRALSLSAHRVLDRLDIENRDHGGKDNGKLIVTFEQFCSYGMDSAPDRASDLRGRSSRVHRKNAEGRRRKRRRAATVVNIRITYHPAEGAPGYGSEEWRDHAIGGSGPDCGPRRARPLRDRPW